MVVLLQLPRQNKTPGQISAAVLLLRQQEKVQMATRAKVPLDAWAKVQIGIVHLRHRMALVPLLRGGPAIGIAPSARWIIFQETAIAKTVTRPTH